MYIYVVQQVAYTVSSQKRIISLRGNYINMAGVKGSWHLCWYSVQSDDFNSFLFNAKLLFLKFFFFLLLHTLMKKQYYFKSHEGNVYYNLHGFKSKL